MRQRGREYLQARRQNLILSSPLPRYFIAMKESHPSARLDDEDARVKPGHDGGEGGARYNTLLLSFTFSAST
jgi:hypothetical protein